MTLIEVIVVVVIVGVIIALLLPAIGSAPEASRRMACTNNLKQIGFALHSYAQSYGQFPAGTICAMTPVQPSNQYDVWAEAAKTGPGFHGTGFLLHILPFLEQNGIFAVWDFTHGVGYNAPLKDSPPNAEKSKDGGASRDIACFYCPTRRIGLRPEDRGMMLTTTWTGGGTDYGGCAGRHAAFTNETGYNLCDASMVYTPTFVPTAADKSGTSKKVEESEATRWGVFGRVNVATKFGDITDGVSNTIMIGELQRITTISPGSKDGWAIGGPATLFTTGAMMSFDGKTCKSVAPPDIGTMMNNHFFGSPGSEHSSCANFGLADGCVRLLSTSIDPNVFALLGSMADRQACPIP